MSDEIKVKKDHLYLGIIAILAVALAYTWLVYIPSLSALPESSNKGESPPAPSPAPSSGEGKGSEGSEGVSFAKIREVPLGTLPPLGEESAPIALVEFSDFQCPFCARLFSQTLPQIKENYVKKGKARFYYRDLPLQAIHPNALPAAYSARCANEQGKFWEMHDLLFERQALWAGQPDPKDTFVSYAEELGLDIEAFSQCYDNAKYQEDITKDVSDAAKLAVRGTPAVFIIIPKSVASKEEVVQALSSLEPGLARNVAPLETDSEWIIFVSGALPYSAFEPFLSLAS